MKNISRRQLLFLMGITAINPAHAFFGAGDIVSDPGHTAQTIAAEAARAADAAREIQVQLNQYQMMVRNAVSLGDPIFKPLGDTFRSLYQVYMQGQSLAWRLQNLDQQFSLMYPSYYTYMGTMGQGTRTFPEKYRQWSDRSSDSLRNALRTSGMNMDEMDSDQARLAMLVQRSGSSVGRMQALQAGNEIAAEQVRQLQRLQMLAYDNIKMQAEYLAIERDRMALDDAGRAYWRRSQPTNSPGQEF